LQFPARIPASPEQVGKSCDSWLQQLVTVYQLAGYRAKPGGGNFYRNSNFCFTLLA
jgi:hypothetical protein